MISLLFNCHINIIAHILHWFVCFYHTWFYINVPRTLHNRIHHKISIISMFFLNRITYLVFLCLLLILIAWSYNHLQPGPQLSTNIYRADIHSFLTHINSMISLQPVYWVKKFKLLMCSTLSTLVGRFILSVLRLSIVAS